MKSLTTLLLLGALFFTGCGPKNFMPAEPITLTFDKKPHYTIQEELNAIPKPDAPKRIYAKVEDSVITVVDTAEEATHVVFAPSEYAKVTAVIKLAKTYKDVILGQETLVNNCIDQSNALKEIIAAEQQKSLMYRELWIISENAYRQEAYEHKVDNAINRVGTWGLAGTIIVLLFAL